MFFLLVVVGAGLTAFALLHPRSPLPSAWHPFEPLNIQDEITPLTQYKLTQALYEPEACFAALETGAEFVRMPDLDTSPQCFIRHRVELRSVAGLSLDPVETRCQTALRLAMWAEHGVKPAAERHLGIELSGLRHASSYACRQIRTTSGFGARMSTHATADSIDISGVFLKYGSAMSLQDNWDTDDVRADFFRDLRDSACLWFQVTLGPDYNSLHADHFHLQNTGWGLCR